MITIAIDGPAASGKGTLARKIASALNLAYMDTGALYRAVAFQVLHDGLSVKDKRDVLDAVKTLKKHIDKQGAQKTLDNPTLREDRIGTEASRVAAIQDVRTALLDIQRDFAQSPGQRYDGAVLDGRDIGTTIAPNATVKIFVTAHDTIRAKRRLKELQSKGLSVTYDTVLADMRDRDKRDAHTLEAHLDPGYQTNTLDTTDLNPDEAFDAAMSIIKKTLSSQA